MRNQFSSDCILVELITSILAVIALNLPYVLNLFFEKRVLLALILSFIGHDILIQINHSLFLVDIIFFLILFKDSHHSCDLGIVAASALLLRIIHFIFKIYDHLRVNFSDLVIDFF